MAFLNEAELPLIGYRLLDTDHQRLMELLNRLHEQSLHHADLPSVDAVFSELIGYTRTHFIHEETLMRRTAYPQFIPHKIQHDRLMKQIEDLRKKFAAGQVGLSQETCFYLKSWLCDHIGQVDLLLAKWLNKHAPAEGDKLLPG